MANENGTKSTNGPTWAWLITIALFCLVLVGLASCGPSSPTATPTIQHAIGSEVTLACGDDRDCSAHHFKVVLWNEPGFQSANHPADVVIYNTKAMILDQATVEGRLWYKVRTPDGPTGWVEAESVNQQVQQVDKPGMQLNDLLGLLGLLVGFVAFAGLVMSTIALVWVIRRH